MPLYQLRCSKCGDEKQVFRPVILRDDLPVCICEGLFQRIIVAPSVRTDIQPYRSPASGKMINSRTQMREDLKASGCILSEPGLEKDILRNREATKEKAFAPIAAAVDKTVSALLSSGKIES